jgi:dTDP-4-dehydrorhamnose 3,5-epimerase
MQIVKTLCDGLHLLELRKLQDERGWFARLYCSELFEAMGLVGVFPQINQSQCLHRGIFRGLHYQMSPKAEAKVVRCVVGEVLDIAVDVRRGSPTFLKWYATRLAADDAHELYVGPGFAHGYMSLTDGATVLYQSSQPFTPSLEGRVHYLDPRVGIEWPPMEMQVSPKDASTPFLDPGFEGIDV